MGDRIARAYEAVIGVLASRVDLLAADHGGGSGRIAIGLSGNLAHVAVLAGDARLSCRAVAELIPHDLKLDAQVDGNLVAADAELRLGDLGVREHTAVDTVAAPAFAGLDGVGLLIGEDLLEDALLPAPVDRVEDLARLDPALAVDLAVLLLDPVAGDAAHALARDLAHLPQRRFAVLAELGADLLMAAYAERADRTFGHLLELLLERVEHRRDGRVGMLRRRPFLVDLLVAFATLGGGGIERECLLIDRRDWSFLAVLGFCLGGEHRHLPMAVRFRVGRHPLLAADCGTSLSGRLCVLSQSQSGLRLCGLGLATFAGRSDSALAEKCCVTEQGTCESAGQHRIAHQPFPPLDFRAAFPFASPMRERHPIAVRHNSSFSRAAPARLPIIQSGRRSTARGSGVPRVLRDASLATLG